MTKILRLLAALAVLLVPAAGIAAAAPATAAARSDAPRWQAKVYPREGADDEPIQILTSGGCPAGAPNILGRVYGTGFADDGTNVIGNTDAGVSHEHGFTTGLFSTMRDFMYQQDTPVPLRGTYTFVVTCRTPELEKSHGDYVVAIRFTDPHHWVAAPPVTTKQGPTVPAGASGASGDSGVSPDDGEGDGSSGSDGQGNQGLGSSAGGSGSSSDQDGSNDGSGSGSGSAGQEADPAAAASSGPGGLSPLSWFLVGTGVLIAIGTVVLLRREQ